MGRLGGPALARLTIPGLVTALRFLTIVPVPGRALEGSEALGRGAGWFPLIGLALGGLLAMEERVLSVAFPSLLTALLALTTWKLLTGGIHLDGLADSLDGLAGRSPDQRLAIMRDGRIGVFGAAGLCLTLLIALVALAGLSAPVRTRALVLAPAVGRLSPLFLARAFPPATPREGSGAAFMGALTPGALAAGLAVVALSGGAIAGAGGLVAAAAGLAVAWAVAGFLSRRLAGLTGDGLGAGVELAELGVLLAFASLHHLGLL